MAIDLVSMILANDYTEESLQGAGALKGKDGKDGKSAYEIAKSNGFTGTEAEWLESLKGTDGLDGKDFEYSDFTQEQLEALKVKGDDGFSPTITENADNTDKIYKLDITTADSTFTTPNLKGADGTGGTGGSGEENTIESISVNGTPISPDVNKNVDITVPSIDGLATETYVDNKVADYTKTVDLADVATTGSYNDLADKPTIPSLDGYAKTSELPTKVSQLENDSNYLSSIPEEYVTETELSAKGYLTEHQDISGKVDKVEGKSLISDTEIARLATVDNYNDTDIRTELANKADATAIPSKVSELTNDSNYQTAEQVNSTVTTEIAKVVADAPESLNTLKEMSDWIAGHENDASAMNSAISDNKTAITALQTGKADKSEIPTTVAELTDSADYAKKTDLHSHTNKTVLDGITSTKVSDWDSAKTHADSAHAPSNAQENIIESVKVNNEEITPDESKAVNIDLSGYAEHDEIVGENLIPYPYAQPERTTNGITFTFADDGSVIANGTATENADFSVCVRTNFGTDAALMLKPGIYAITGCPEGGSDSTYRIQVQFGDKTELKYSLKADYGKGFVFEVTEEYAQYACQIQCHVQKGYTVTDLVFKPMLVLGSVLKEYQPYKLSRESLRTDIDNVAELASRVDNQFATASGDFITVNDSVDGKLVELCVKGNSFQQTYSGKNLLNLDGFQASSTVTVDKCDTENNSVIITFTESVKLAQAFGKYFQLANGQKYTFSAICNSYPDNIILSIQVYKAIDTTFITNYIIPKTDNFITFTASSEYKYRLLVQSQSDTALSTTCEFSNIQLELGDTATEYEPYVGGIPSPSPLYPQAINSVGDDGELVVKSRGKNIIPFPYFNSSDIRVGVTATVNLDSSITLKGTATSNYFFVLLHRNANGKGFAKKLRGKTVTISGGTSRPVLSFAVYDEDGNNVTPPNNEMLYDYGGGVTVTIPDNACDMYSYYYFSSGNTVDVTLRPQLEVSDVVTVYEPYKSSTTTIPLSEPLRAIGDVKDEITYQDGKWGVLRRTGKYVVDGTESWVLDSDHIVDCGISVRLGGYANILKGISSVTGNTKDMITDYLGCRELSHIPYYATSNSVQEDRGSGTYRTPGNIWISFGASDIEKMGITKDIDSVKAWLSSHNITFIYPLGTPVFEPFADQTLPYLSTYDGVTNISNDDALSAEMTVKYPTTDASGVGSRNESRITELAKDTDDKFDDVNDSLSVIGKCKNLLNPTLQTTTKNGVTCTNNGDGTYTLNGTPPTGSGFSIFDLSHGTQKNIYGGCLFTGTPLPANEYRLYIGYYNEEGEWRDEKFVGSEGIVIDGSYPRISINIICNNGASPANNLIFKPMITTDLSATYDDFVPYTGEGETLASDVAEIKKDLGGLTFSASGTTLTITDGTNTWTLGANS